MEPISNENSTSSSSLESIEKLRNLPIVESAWQQSGNVYGMVKDHNQYFQWALGSAEDVIQRAVTLSAPLVQKLDKPIKFVDQKIVQGIETLELSAPIIKETPQEVYNQTKNKILETVQSKFTSEPSEVNNGTIQGTGQRAASLKELSWRKSNELLATQCGGLAMAGLDTTASLAERLIDYFFPDTDAEAVEQDVPVSAQLDPTLHTVQTISFLSQKATRRMYRNIYKHLQNINTRNIREYLAVLIAVLRITQIGNSINQRILNPHIAVHNIVTEAGQHIANTGYMVKDIVSGGGQMKAVIHSELGNAIAGLSTVDNVIHDINGKVVKDLVSGVGQANATIHEQLSNTVAGVNMAGKVVHDITAGSGQVVIGLLPGGGQAIATLTSEVSNSVAGVNTAGKVVDDIAGHMVTGLLPGHGQAIATISSEIGNTVAGVNIAGNIVHDIAAGAGQVVAGILPGHGQAAAMLSSEVANTVAGVNTAGNIVHDIAAGAGQVVTGILPGHGQAAAMLSSEFANTAAAGNVVHDIASGAGHLVLPGLLPRANKKPHLIDLENPLKNVSNVVAATSVKTLMEGKGKGKLF